MKPVKKKLKLWQEFFYLYRSLLAIQGGIICWTGAWNLLDLHMFTKGPRREWGYTIVGTLGLLVTNSFISNSGIGTVRFRQWKHYNPQTTGQIIFAFLAVYGRSVLAFISSIVLWVGSYNLIDLYLFTDWFYLPPNRFGYRKDLITLLIGIFLLWITVRQRPALPTRHQAVSLLLVRAHSWARAVCR